MLIKQAILVAILPLLSLSRVSGELPEKWSLYFEDCGLSVGYSGAFATIAFYDNPPTPDQLVFPQQIALYNSYGVGERPFTQWRQFTGPATFGNGVNMTWQWNGAGKLRAGNPAVGSVLILGLNWTLVEVPGTVVYAIEESSRLCTAYYGAGPGQNGSVNLTP